MKRRFMALALTTALTFGLAQAAFAVTKKPLTKDEIVKKQLQTTNAKNDRVIPASVAMTMGAITGEAPVKMTSGKSKSASSSVLQKLKDAKGAMAKDAADKAALQKEADKAQKKPAAKPVVKPVSKPVTKPVVKPTPAKSKTPVKTTKKK